MKKLMPLLILALPSCTTTIINYDPVLRQVESHNVPPIDTVGVYVELIDEQSSSDE